MHRAVAALLALSWLSGAGATPASAEADADLLAGRLGGSYASFQETYGEPTRIDGSVGAVFDAPGDAFVAVEFDRAAQFYDDADPALVITFGPARDPERSTTDPDPADWSLDEGMTRALDLLPADVDLGDPVQLGPATRAYPCRSSALAGAFGSVEGTGCQLLLIMPTPETVSFGTVALTMAAASTGPATPEASACEGLIDWSNAVADRLAAAQTLLDRIAAIDDTDPAAPGQLREIAAAFAELLSAQRESSAPPVAARVAYHLIAAFTAYNSALDAAAAALETSDNPAMTSAIQRLTAANRSTSSATSALTAIASECGLDVET